MRTLALIDCNNFYVSCERVFKVNCIYDAWRAARAEAGLPDLRWHDLRHTNATRVERSRRVSLRQLGRHLGHTSEKTTYRYVNQDLSDLEEIAAVLDELNERAAADEPVVLH